MMLLDEQMHSLEKTIKENQEKLANLRRLTRSLKKAPTISPATINDIAYLMENKTALRKVYRLILFTGLPMSILQWTTLLLGFLKHIWWPFLLWLPSVIYGIAISRYYFSHAAYICPHCHEVLKPTFKETFWAKHTPYTRKLTCPHCGYHSYCIEVALNDENSE